MPSQPIRHLLLALLLVLFSISMAACVRPVPGQESPPTATPAAVVPTVPSTVVEEPVQPPTDTTGTDTTTQPGDTTQPVEPTPAGEGTAVTPPPAQEGTTDPNAGTGEQVVVVPPEGEQTVEDVVTEAVPTAVPPTTTTTTTPGQRPTTEVIHIVQPGENLFRIGLMYGYSWVVLQQYNNLPNPNFLTVGQQIRIPGDSGTGGGVGDVPPGGTTYVVQRGDTLFSIGRKFGVDWQLIAEANGIVNPNLIFPGQVLKIPAPGTTLPPTSGTNNDTQAGIGGAGDITHVVQEGETLFSVALRYGVPWPYIAQANGLEAPFALYAGQTLVISSGN
jgi:LysM repeat protein